METCFNYKQDTTGEFQQMLNMGTVTFVKVDLKRRKGPRS